MNATFEEWIDMLRLEPSNTDLRKIFSDWLEERGESLSIVFKTDWIWVDKLGFEYKSHKRKIEDYTNAGLLLSMPCKPGLQYVSFEQLQRLLHHGLVSPNPLPYNRLPCKGCILVDADEHSRFYWEEGIAKSVKVAKVRCRHNGEECEWRKRLDPESGWASVCKNCGGCSRQNLNTSGGEVRDLLGGMRDFESYINKRTTYRSVTDWGPGSNG